MHEEGEHPPLNETLFHFITKIMFITFNGRSIAIIRALHFQKMHQGADASVKFWLL